MKRFFFLLTIIAFLSQTFAQNTLSLKECIDQAIDKNLQLQKQQMVISLLTNQYEMAKYDRLPDLNGSLSGGFYFGRFFSYDQLSYVNEKDTYVNADLSTNAVLFSGFYKENRIAQKESELESSVKEFQTQSNDIALQVVNNYLQIIYNREQAEAMKQQLEVTKKQIERTTELAKAGSVPQGGILELKAQAASEKSQITTYLNLERQALTSLKQAMNIMTDTIDIIVPDQFNVDSLYLSILPISEIYNTASSFLPEVAAAQAQKEAKSAAIEIAKSAYYPTLLLHASLSTRYNKLAVNQENPGAEYSFTEQMVDYGNSVVGVSLNIPIFNKLQTKHQVQNAQIDLEMANTDLSITLQNIYKTIETAVNDARSAYDTYQAAKENVSASKESFRYAEQKFNAGLMNSVDYNLAKSNYMNAAATMVSSRFELLFRVKIIDFYLGKDIDL